MTTILIVGAGVAGLTAARELRAEGLDVTVIDKGHRIGGRIATRTIGSATFDHGAQFFTTKGPWFRQQVDRWVADGVAKTWFHGSPDRDAPSDPDGYPRFRGTPTMRRLAEHLADGSDIRLGTVVELVRATARGWRLTTRMRDGTPGPTVDGDALVLTAPVPQTLTMLDAGAVALQPETRAVLEQVAYEPCIAVLAVPTGRPALPARGAIRLPDGPIGWLTDNVTTGASATPAVTIHASGAFSSDRYDRPDAEVGPQIVSLAREQLGTDATCVHVHRWRYSSPIGRADEDDLLDQTSGQPLVVAGDAMTGGRIEGAAISGHAAARRLLTVLGAERGSPGTASVRPERTSSERRTIAAERSD